jgi:hypothetical protein
MPWYLSIEWNISAPNMPSVRLTSVFNRRYSNEVYRVVKTEEIPLFMATMNFWNVRVVERYVNGCAFLSFDGLPGEQIIFILFDMVVVRTRLTQSFSKRKWMCHTLCAWAIHCLLLKTSNLSSISEVGLVNEGNRFIFIFSPTDRPLFFINIRAITHQIVMAL